MKITIATLRKLINEELQKRRLQEKQDERKNDSESDSEEKLSVAKALDVLENASETAPDSDEVRWYLTKIGETFGLEPEENE